jgi:hypothetical protein
MRSRMRCCKRLLGLIDHVTGGLAGGVEEVT